MSVKKLVVAFAAGALSILTTDTWAQDLDAKKTPGQLFSQTCVACHRGPQGLAKGKPPSAIAGFLRQHYTSSARSAGELAGYLASVKGEPPRERTGRTPRQAAAEPAAQPQGAAAEEKPKTAAERRKEREEKRARAEARAQARAAALNPGDVPLVKRPRRAGEPATVSTDPDPVIVSAEPTPVFHDRALSRAQESKKWPAEPPAQAAAPATDATRTAAVDSGQGAGAPVATPPAASGGMAASAPAEAAPQGAAAAEINGAAQPAAPPIEDQVFSTPLP